MQFLHRALGLGGKQRTGLNFISLGILPVLPDSSHREQLMIDMTAIGLFKPILKPPFVETVRRHQATAPPVGSAKRWLFGDGFSIR